MQSGHETRRPARRRLIFAATGALGFGALLALGAVRAAPSGAPVNAPTRVSTAGAGASPLIGAGDPEEPLRDFGGRAAQRLVAGAYLYFEVETDEGARHWVATLKTSDAREGDRVDVSTYAARQGFESKRLGRRFERLLFGRVRRNDG